MKTAHLYEIYFAVGIFIFALAYWAEQDYHTEVVPILAGMGCGLLLWDLFKEMAREAKQAQKFLAMIETVAGMAMGGFICWGADKAFGEGGGLFVAVGLNFLFDAIIGDEPIKIMATAFDNMALAYMLGARCALNNGDETVYVYMPGVLYVVIGWLVTYLRPHAPILPELLTRLYNGSELGIIIYTSVVELAPHIVENDTTWVSATALAMMIIVAPLLHNTLERYTRGDKKDEGSEGAHLVVAPADSSDVLFPRRTGTLDSVHWRF